MIRFSPRKNVLNFYVSKLVVSAAFTMTVIACCIFKIATIGWYVLIIGFFLYPLMLILHSLAHYFSLKWCQSINEKLFWLAILSDLLLIFAFLVQQDFGDDRSFFVFTEFFGVLERNYAYTFWERNAFLLNPLAFIPVIISWLFLLRQGRRQSDLGSSSPAYITSINLQ